MSKTNNMIRSHSGPWTIMTMLCGRQITQKLIKSHSEINYEIYKVCLVKGWTDCPKILPCTEIDFLLLSSVTGNANYRMTQTSFTLMGFTQPQSALPIIEDAQNNAKGFTSRILWFFPKPVFCSLKDTALNPEETAEVKAFRNKLGL